MNDFLADMTAAARVRVEEARRLRPLPRPAHAAPHPHRLLRALQTPRGDGMAVIAEVKRSSPSRGAIAPGLDAAAQAAAYAAAGADAVSVLTEPTRFGGCLADLEAVAAACVVPVLRKDFVVDAYQVGEAAAAGAAAVLLIVGALEDDALRALIEECDACGLDALVEVHDEDELRRALAAGAPLVGINNRNLRTLTVDLNLTVRLAPRVGEAALVVAESGIASAADARHIAAGGARAVLVGEALVRWPHERLAALVRDLRGAGTETQP
jgi:indole-3-glycerol phosphate synthase